MTLVLLDIPCPDRATAVALARTLVEERLIACGNVIDGVTSVYRWEGTLEESAEVILLAKTTNERSHAAQRRIEELHPYDIPAITASIVTPNRTYVWWVTNELHGPEAARAYEEPESRETDDTWDIGDVIEQGDYVALTKLLSTHPELATAELDFDDRPLHYACWQKQTHMVGLLLEHDHDVNHPGDQGRTPLHYAVFEGDIQSVGIVDLLIKAGANPSIVDKRGYTPAALAKLELTDGLKEVLELLGE